PTAWKTRPNPEVRRPPLPSRAPEGSLCCAGSCPVGQPRVRQKPSGGRLSTRRRGGPGLGRAVCHREHWFPECRWNDRRRPLYSPGTAQGWLARASSEFLGKVQNGGGVNPPFPV